MQAIAVGAQVQAERGPCFERAAAPELVAQLLGRGDQEVVELLQGGVRAFRAPDLATDQLTNRLDDPACLLRDRARSPAEGGAGGEFRVDRVALAEPLPGVWVRLVDLDDLDPVRQQRAHQAGGVGAG